MTPPPPSYTEKAMGVRMEKVKREVAPVVMELDLEAPLFRAPFARFETCGACVSVRFNVHVSFLITEEDAVLPETLAIQVRGPAAKHSKGGRVSPAASSSPDSQISSNDDYDIDDSDFDEVCVAVREESKYVATLALTSPGPYRYRVTGLGDTSYGFFLADPVLFANDSASAGDQACSLDRVRILSVVPSWVGKLGTWPSKLGEMAQSGGYNALHFLPVQLRGASNSPYSIQNQLILAPVYDASVKTEGVNYPQVSEQAMAATLEAVRNVSDKDKLLLVVDVVWNHTSFDSKWLLNHPEAVYNPFSTAPHLLAAFELDIALRKFSARIEPNKELSTPCDTCDEPWLTRVLEDFSATEFQHLKLWEYFAIDIDEHSENFLKNNGSQPGIVESDAESLPYNPAALAERLTNSGACTLATLFGSQRDPHELDYNEAWREVKKVIGRAPVNCLPEQRAEYLKSAVDLFRKALDIINVELYKRYDDCKASVFSNLGNTVRWLRLNPSGPKLGQVTKHNPLVTPYFTIVSQNAVEDIAEYTVCRYHKSSKKWFAAANNGWIWNADPRIDFASPASEAYLRREVVAWGDCVKLRYGQSPSDSPFLWEHMRRYTCQMARLFDGFRIDNCHSTPVHVARWLLREARGVRPSLYVVAELFSGDPKTDQLYVAELGLNSLIREAMQASHPADMCHLVHTHSLYSCKPLGSFTKPPLLLQQQESHCLHALFMDCTHDNKTPAQQRTVVDTLPNTALVYASATAVGSTAGYDLCLPKTLEIVTDCNLRYPDFHPGSTPMLTARQILSKLHEEIAQKGFSEIHVDFDNAMINVTRCHPTTHNGYLFIAHTAFHEARTVRALHQTTLSRTKCKLFAAYSLTCTGDEPTKLMQQSKEELTTLKGLPLEDAEITGWPTLLCDVAERINISVDAHTYNAVINIANSTPGSVYIFELEPYHIDSCNWVSQRLEKVVDQGLFDNLNLEDFRTLLYSSCTEEVGVYSVPGAGDLEFAGLEGAAQELRKVAAANKLSSPICDNLRQGSWLPNYLVSRLNRWPKFAKVAANLEQEFSQVTMLPAYTVPRLVYSVIQRHVDSAQNACLNTVLCSPVLQKQPTSTADLVKKLQGSQSSRIVEFGRKLAMVAVQLIGEVEGVTLEPRKGKQASLAAGLPHFAKDYMRCWGRDTFIALKGLMLTNNLRDHAKEHILAFASVVRHGMVPNLLDSGRNPRYNARDAVWFWLDSIQEYCNLINKNILKEKVSRRFPVNSAEDDGEWVEWNDKRAFTKSNTLLEIIIECLQRHARGIRYREHGAGSRLDHAMSDQGFNVEAGVDWQTGFVVGGSESNCGTWMDKMGDSHKAGTFGRPATPRNGAAIELVCLAHRCVKWIDTELGGFVHVAGVTDASGKLHTWKEWTTLIEQNFEKEFYDPALEHYADCARGGSRLAACKQFRPNQFVGMSISPNLFNKSNAQKAIAKGFNSLLGPMGMKTLSPGDPEYNGTYDPRLDVSCPRVANGFNYHNGPEWLWLSAKFHLAAIRTSSNQDFAKARVRRWLERGAVVNHMMVYAGLPELTNADGVYCLASCPTQAWSAAAFLELCNEVLA